MSGNRLDARTMTAITMLVISMAASVSTGLLYRNSRRALHEADAALVSLRSVRLRTDYRLCLAVNRIVAVNNHDRATILRGIRLERVATVATRRYLLRLTTPDGKLLGLLLLALAQAGKNANAQNLRDRPRLAEFRCVRFINHPTGMVPTSSGARRPN